MRNACGVATSHQFPCLCRQETAGVVVARACTPPFKLCFSCQLYNKQRRRNSCYSTMPNIQGGRTCTPGNILKLLLATDGRQQAEAAGHQHAREPDSVRNSAEHVGNSRDESCTGFGNGHTPRILLVCSYLEVVNSRRCCFQSSPKNQGPAWDAGPGHFAAACSTSTSPRTCPPRCDNPPAGNCRSSGNAFPGPSSLTGRFEPSP